MGFYQIPAGLNFKDRARRANVLPITLGPHGSNFDDVVDAMKQLKRLDKGIIVEINGVRTLMCVFTLCYLGDMPQQQANSGMKTQRAARGCRLCFVHEDERGDLAYDTKALGRYHYQVIAMRKEMLSRRTKREREIYAAKWGMNIDSSPLVAISPALDIIMTRPGDPAHSEYNGLGRLMHEILIQAVLTTQALKSYVRTLRMFPFPKGWGRLQSPLHHLKSYSLSDHARWSIIIPGLLRSWLTERHIQPFFFNAARSHTRDPVGFIVSTYAAAAKSTSLLVSDRIESEDDRLNLHAIILRARQRFQQLCTDAAGGFQANPRRGSSTFDGGRSRSATPARPFVSTSTPSSATPDTPGLMGPPPSISVAQADKKGAMQYRADAKRPNIHTALHYLRMTWEYGLPGNIATLIGEDKHR